MNCMLRLHSLSKQYRKSWAVRDVHLELAEGEFLTLLGPSGSGKTTTLKMVAGLELPTAGEIWVKGENITFLSPDKRGLGMVFQNYALFPHMTVRENVAFPLKMRRSFSRAEIESKVREILRLVQLEEYIDRYPSQLSGGQQQRVALARALVFGPPIVLMDEPLGALDKKLRTAMQLEILRIQKALQITTIYVTHDQEEALTLSDRIAIMNAGRIEQIGAPKEIYEEPVSAFVADFIGESNLLPVDVVSMHGNQARLKVKSAPGGPVLAGKCMNPDALDTANSFLAVRPEKIEISRVEAGTESGLKGKVEDAIYLGEMVRYKIRIGSELELCAKQQATGNTAGFLVGDDVSLSWPKEHGVLVS